MSSTDHLDATDGEPDDVAAEIAVLREENRRLRNEHQRLLRTRYHRTALGFGGLAILASAGALRFGAVRDILLVIAAIAAFSGLLTYYLTPERFVAATVSEGIYESIDTTGQELIAELGLSDTQLYLPTEDGVRVFLPQHQAYELPKKADRSTLFVVSDEEHSRGVSLWPTGRRLFAEFQSTATTPLELPTIGAQLSEALVEQFELVDQATVDSQEPGQLTVAVTGSAYGPVDRFDHPIASFIATGIAATVSAPVELDTTQATDSRADYLVTCRWTPPDD